MITPYDNRLDLLLAIVETEWAREIEMVAEDLSHMTYSELAIMYKRAKSRG